MAPSRGKTRCVGCGLEVRAEPYDQPQRPALFVGPAPSTRHRPACHGAVASRPVSTVATVTIEYDGEGDEGQINAILAFDAKDSRVALNKPVGLSLYPGKQATAYVSLYEALDDFAWLLLAHFHDGFVDNEGGFGTIDIDVAQKTVLLDHSDRVIETVDTRTEV